MSKDNVLLSGKAKSRMLMGKGARGECLSYHGRSPVDESLLEHHDGHAPATISTMSSPNRFAPSSISPGSPAASATPIRAEASITSSATNAPGIR